MTRVSRVIAPPRALTLLAVLFLALSPVVWAETAHAASDTPATAASAATWLRTQQQSDGGFEVAGFAGFETCDVALAIAGAAQTGGAWSTAQARNALAAIHQGGPSGPTPLDALDSFAATVTAAGDAAKTIVLSAAPLGLDPAAFDAAADGSPVDLVAKLDAGCGANTASFGPAFLDTVYGILAKRLVCGAAPSNAVATVRGWRSRPMAAGASSVIPPRRVSIPT